MKVKIQCLLFIYKPVMDQNLPDMSIGNVYKICELFTGNKLRLLCTLAREEEYFTMGG